MVLLYQLLAEPKAVGAVFILESDIEKIKKGFGWWATIYYIDGLKRIRKYNDDSQPDELNNEAAALEKVIPLLITADRLNKQKYL